MNEKLFRENPRDYVMGMLESGAVSAEQMFLAALVYMSDDDVRRFLDANELSPRFLNKEYLG